MTAAEQQISGNPAAMENAQAHTTVTDQAKVQDIISRMDRAHETPMFHRIVTLVAAGMLMDSIDVYIGSAVASSTLATRWSTVAQNSTIVPAFLFTGVFGLMYAFQTSTVSAIIVGFLLMMCLYVLMASVVAVYAPELFATKVRFRCVGFANAVAKLLNVLMPMVVGWMLTSLGATSIFVAISAIAIASMLIVGFFGAETAQKSVG